MKKRKYIKILPSIFTLGNILCGFLALNNVVKGTPASLISAAWWIIIAGILDALDGKVARMTGTSSEFGIELDSIADVISFGVAPAILIYHYMLFEAGKIGFILAFFYLAAGSIRLAKFNTIATTGKKSSFIGMPIPSGAGILASYILFTENVWSGLANLDFVIALTFFASLAMLSRFKYSVFPHIGFSTRSDKITSFLFIGYIMLVARFPDEAFFPTGILYLLSGPVKTLTTPAVNHVFNKVVNR